MKSSIQTTGARSRKTLLVYGVHAVLEKLQATPGEVLEVLLLPGNRGPGLRRVEQAARQQRCRVSEIDARGLDSLAGGARHQGVAARVAPFAYGSFEALLAEASSDAGCVVFVDGVVDPQNLGSIVRTCETMGVGRIVIPRDRAAGVTGAVIKASAGAVHHVEVYRVSNLLRGLAALRERGYWLVGLDAQAKERICDRAYPRKLAVVLGGEGRGMRPLIRRSCDYLVSIPMQGRVGSLNVGVAWGMFAYELSRQGISTGADDPR